MFEFRRVDDHCEIVANENDPPTHTAMSFGEFCAFVRAQRQVALAARAERVAAARKLFLQYTQEMGKLGFHAISHQELCSMERELASRHEIDSLPAENEILQSSYLMYGRDVIQKSSTEEMQ